MLSLYFAIISRGLKTTKRKYQKRRFIELAKEPDWKTLFNDIVFAQPMQYSSKLHQFKHKILIVIERFETTLSKLNIKENCKM